MQRENGEKKPLNMLYFIKKEDTVVSSFFVIDYFKIKAENRILLLGNYILLYTAFKKKLFKVTDLF